jgi:hypothetical protein
MNSSCIIDLNYELHLHVLIVYYFARLEVLDQGVSREGTATGLFPWFLDSFLLLLSPYYLSFVFVTVQIFSSLKDICHTELRLTIKPLF